MRQEDSKSARLSLSGNIADLPLPEAVDASKVADEVKGGAEVVTPRDPATGLPTGKRQ